jgi:hypothetical protein
MTDAFDNAVSAHRRDLWLAPHARQWNAPHVADGRKVIILQSRYDALQSLVS